MSHRRTAISEGPDAKAFRYPDDPASGPKSAHRDSDPKSYYYRDYGNCGSDFNFNTTAFTGSLHQPIRFPANCRTTTFHTTIRNFGVSPTAVRTATEIKAYRVLGRY